MTYNQIVIRALLDTFLMAISAVIGGLGVAIITSSPMTGGVCLFMAGYLWWRTLKGILNAP